LEKIKQEEIEGFNTGSRLKRRSTRRGIEFNIVTKRPSDFNIQKISESETPIPSIEKRGTKEALNEVSKKMIPPTNNMIPKSPKKKSNKSEYEGPDAVNMLGNVEYSSNSIGAIKLLNKSVSLL
jgi:hypothetical protein